MQILQTGQEIMELDTSGFATQGPTVFAGNIGDNKYIIQVSPMGIRLLEGGKIHQTSDYYMFIYSCFIDMLSFNSVLSDTAPLHPCGPGLSHSSLLCGGSIRGHHDRRGSGHHVCAEDRLVHGEDPPAGPAETTDPHCEYMKLSSPFRGSYFEKSAPCWQKHSGWFCCFSSVARFTMATCECEASLHSLIRKLGSCNSLKQLVKVINLFEICLSFNSNRA